jgi:hypothetical protein
MAITQKTTVSIGALVVLLPAIGSALWGYEKHRDTEVALATSEATTEVAQASYTQNRDVELELIDAKLKMYRMLREHRELTEDELADEEWLKERKRILLEEQRERRG